MVTLGRLGILATALMLFGTAMTATGAEQIQGTSTYRPEVLGRVGVVAAGRHFAAEAGMQMLARGGNAVDAGVAATFAAAVTEISHFGLGGEVPIVLYLAGQKKSVVINGQGTAPQAASAELFRRLGGIPENGPSAGTVPAVVDALTVALAEYGRLSLAEVLAPAIELADGFPWYEFLTRMFTPELEAIRRYPSGARIYLQGPGGSIPAVGSIFRQPELARTLRALAEEEQRNRVSGRKEAIYAARDRFYKGDIGRRIAQAVQESGGLLTAEDLAGYHGRVEAPTHVTFSIPGSPTYDIFKTGFWGQGPVLLETLNLLRGFDLKRMGHNSTAYIHTVTEALNLALADRDTYYGDPDFSAIPAAGLLSEAYAAERRQLIDPSRASPRVRPGDPWRFDAGRSEANRASVGFQRVQISPDTWGRAQSPDTTCVNAVDAQGNLFSASPSSAWVFGGVFVAGDTGVPLGNRMQAFVLNEDGHPNLVQGGKRPRTTLTPTVVLRDGKPYLALSSPGGDSQDQQALQVFLNIVVFGMSPQEAVEAPRFNSLHYERSFASHDYRGGALEIENRVPPEVVEGLRRLGHKINLLGSFMMDTGTTVVGIDPTYGTLFGAADLRRERFVVGW